ncbi:MAG TPA: ribonuclease H-like domain-containing protein, partial [Acidimicrobiales bacterium]|nr:ribonuclease H-like domain-containing protein [Acidimicrobiales bacterium]
MSETDWMPAYAPWAEVRATISALRKRYRGTRLTDHLDVTLVRDGEEGYIERTHLSSVPVPARPSAEDAEACIRSELSLVWGIGPARESRYRERDTPVTDLGDLLQEDRYSIAAEEILRDLEERRLEPLIDLLRTRLPGRGQLLSTQLVAFADLERTAILDFETLGLFGNVIYLAGIGRFEGGRLVVKQYLAASYDDEPAMLRRVMSELSGVDLLITYNGRTADLPWFASRAAYHRLGAIRQPAHLDLLHACRQRYVRDLAVA